MLYKVVLTFNSVDKTLVCDHSNESYIAVLSCGIFYCAAEVVTLFVWVSPPPHGKFASLACGNCRIKVNFEKNPALLIEKVPSLVLIAIILQNHILQPRSIICHVVAYRLKTPEVSTF